MIRALPLLVLLALAACGADGSPQRQIEPGLRVSGTATIGVAGRN
jgi:hypothetical protein